MKGDSMKKMIALSLIIAALPACQACGHESKQNELSGQVKKLISRTPLICADYTEVDISLGYMKNGVGSISKEDVILTVRNPQDIALLKKAADSGAIVKGTYNVFRFSICEPDHELLSVQLIDQ